ncbi:type VI secretion system-associated protein TagF [Pelomonas sp. P7]|uniref:Type VI secretion system-associated protein TagF n=1 Tax=Pelomonas caseinilytica TaxID=2906763 RepID=A0ABS8XFV5_9BURK|nr:type VI secretion system-associated protein TagF [Pelomonas sp. P7]MCE4538120.1 type VI secretion system-associated protein TagF [Pelomonas sp. P7]
MTAGWYGKLPALGDFASRRLTPEWIAQWDGWLAEGLHQLREAAPDSWLDDYLASPAWRFALLPGCMPDGSGEGLRVGVMIPSVDRVGRYFPLVVVSEPLPRPADGAQVAALWQWAGRIEEIAVNALHDDWSAEALDAALAEAPPPAEPQATDANVPAALTALLGQAAWDGLQGCSLWMHAASGPSVQPALPRGAAFAALFRP